MKTTAILFLYLGLSGPLLAQDTPFGSRSPSSASTGLPGHQAETQPAPAPAVVDSPDLDRLRRDYLQKRGEAVRPVTTWYQSQLEVLQRKLVQSKDVGGALLVRREMDAVRDRSVQEGQDLQKAVAAILVVNSFKQPVVAQPRLGRPPALSGSYQLTLWNAHNGFCKDRGTELYTLEALESQSSVWHSDILKLDWSVTDDPKATVEIPPQSFGIDEIKISIVKWVGNGGGLSEVAVSLDGADITNQCRVSVSEFWQNDGRFAGKSLVDKVTSSAKFGEGYWILPDKKPGYVTIKLPPR